MCNEIERREPQIETLHFSNVYFSWCWEGVGFGQFSVNLRDGKLEANNEIMSRESVRKLLHSWADYVADRSYLDDGLEPPKQIEMFNEVDDDGC